MSTAIVIPARYDSSRYPGKPLVEIKGHSLLKRVWSIAKNVQNVHSVLVATDDSRIADHVESFGGEVVMTSSACRNGTERVLEAIENSSLPVEHVVNLQGDAPLTPPWVLQALIDQLCRDQECPIVTPATRISRELYDRICELRKHKNSTGTLVTFDKNMRALYFSRYPIPYLRSDLHESPFIHKHFGIYGYSVATLRDYVRLEPTEYELAEGLEQLRALENSIPIRIVLVDMKARSQWSLDTPEDVEIIGNIIEREGELVQI